MNDGTCGLVSFICIFILFLLPVHSLRSARCRKKMQMKPNARRNQKEAIIGTYGEHNKHGLAVEKV